MTFFGASSAESLFDYLIPLAIMVLYFFLNSRKRKQKSRSAQPSERAVSAPKPAPPPKPIHVRKKEFSSEMRIASSSLRFEKSKLGSAIAKDSRAVSEKKAKASPAARLLKRATLRDAFLLSEILKPPYIPK